MIRHSKGILCQNGTCAFNVSSLTRDVHGTELHILRARDQCVRSGFGDYFTVRANPVCKAAVSDRGGRDDGELGSGNCQCSITSVRKRAVLESDLDVSVGCEGICLVFKIGLCRCTVFEKSLKKICKSFILRCSAGIAELVIHVRQNTVLFDVAVVCLAVFLIHGASIDVIRHFLCRDIRIVEYETFLAGNLCCSVRAYDGDTRGIDSIFAVTVCPDKKLNVFCRGNVFK